MAKSKAKKQREHLARNGKRNPELNRGKTPDFSTHERKLPSKLGKQKKVDNKYKNWKRHES